MVDKKAASSDAAFFIGSSGHLSSSIGIRSSLIGSSASIHRIISIGSSAHRRSAHRITGDRSFGSFGDR